MILANVNDGVDVREESRNHRCRADGTVQTSFTVEVELPSSSSAPRPPSATVSFYLKVLERVLTVLKLVKVPASQRSTCHAGALSFNVGDRGLRFVSNRQDLTALGSGSVRELLGFSEL